MIHQTNLFSYLIGALWATPHVRAMCPQGNISGFVRELWCKVAGMTTVSMSTGNATLPRLDHNGMHRLCDQVSDRFSVSVADVIDWYRKCRLPHDMTHQSRRSLGHVMPANLDSLYQDLLALTTTMLQTLNDKPEETPDSTLRALWYRAAGMPISAQGVCDAPLPELDCEGISVLHELLRQRFAGKPLAHLTERQQFMGLELNVGKTALVPRKETELLGFAALAVLHHIARERSELRVIDVCTGVGNLAIALAYHEPKAQVYASDLSNDAIGLARRNREQTSLDARVDFRQGDFLAPFVNADLDRKVDLLVCNPPYISTGKVGKLPEEIIDHEPRLAFEGGPFGVKILLRLISEAPRFLRSGGWLAFEVGQGQGPAIMERLRRNQYFTDLCAIENAAGTIRAIVVRVSEGLGVASPSNAMQNQSVAQQKGNEVT